MAKTSADKFSIKNYSPEKMGELTTLLKWWEQFSIRFFLAETEQDILTTEDFDAKFSQMLKTFGIKYANNKEPMEIIIRKGGLELIEERERSGLYRSTSGIEFVQKEDPHSVVEALQKEIFAKGIVMFESLLSQGKFIEFPNTWHLLDLYATLKKYKPEELNGIIRLDPTNESLFDCVTSPAMNRIVISVPLSATKTALTKAFSKLLSEEEKEKTEETGKHISKRTHSMKAWGKCHLLAYIDYKLWCDVRGLKFKKEAFIDIIENEFPQKEKPFDSAKLRATVDWSETVLNKVFLTRLLADALLEEKD